MPLSMIAVLLMPFGLEQWAIDAMGWGIDAVIAIAHWIAGLPGAATLLPSMPIEALIGIVIGMLWLCLWSLPWRWWGLAPIAAAAVAAALAVPPDILISGDGRMFAIRANDGTMLMLGPGSRMLTEPWTKRAGQEGIVFLPQRGRSADQSVACDRSGCVLRRHQHDVALVRTDDAAAEDCKIATLVVAAVALSRACRNQTHTIDLFDLRRNGAYAIWLEREGVRIATDRAWRGERPWVPQLPNRPPARAPDAPGGR